MPKPKSKVPKRVISLGFLIGFTMLLSSVYAANFNLQPYTTCVSGVCSTSLDVSTLGFNTAKINNLKSVNITNFLTKSGIINDFRYSWSGNVLTITGKVSSNVYWSFGAGSDTFDPWWNYTSSVNTTTIINSPALDDAGTNTDDYSYRGITISLANNMTIHFKKHHDSDSTILRILNSAGTNTENLTYVGEWATKTNMTAGTYYILNNLTSGTSHMFQKTPHTFPTSNGTLSVLAGAIKRQSGALANYTTYWFEIEQIMMENMTTQATNIYYTTSLTLNGTEANLTMANSTALNSTAITNLTGSFATIYINGTMSANGTNSATNTTNLSSGLWNVTAWFGNSSINSTLTYWVNMTYTPVFMLNTSNKSYVMCTDNSTLYTHTAKYYNGSFNFTDDYSYCFNGCDNITFTCQPPKYEQNLYLLGIVLAMVIFVGFVYNKVRT